MKINEVKTFEDLEQYLRQFSNFLGDPVPYDFNGASRLFLAILDNLARHHLEADLEEFRPWFTEDQRQFLRTLGRPT